MYIVQLQGVQFFDYTVCIIRNGEN